MTDRSTFLADRQTGIGGTDIAAIVGVHPNRTKFDVYAEKVGLVDQAIENTRMRWGKRLERAIAEGYSERTGKEVEWLDKSFRHPERPWQMYTPDALVVGERRGLDCKNVAFDQSHKWGAPGTDQIPDHMIVQFAWYLDCLDYEAWDAAALFGGNDLEIYTVNADPDLQGTLREAGERFVRDHLLPKVPPPLDDGWASEEYIKTRFPRNKGAVRQATPAETELLRDLRSRDEEKNAAEKAYDVIENQVREAIGDDDGIQSAVGKVTARLCKDTTGTDWKAVAMALATIHCAGSVDATLAALAAECEVVTRKGSRRINKAWSK